jgi:hypothetical protein
MKILFNIVILEIVYFMTNLCTMKRSDRMRDFRNIKSQRTRLFQAMKKIRDGALEQILLPQVQTKKIPKEIKLTGLGSKKSLSGLASTKIQDGGDAAGLDEEDFEFTGVELVLFFDSMTSLTASISASSVERSGWR